MPHFVVAAGPPAGNHARARRTPRWHRLVARVLLLAMTCVASATGWSLHAQPAGSYQVIVNDGNPVSTLTRTEISRLFLKKTVTWKGGGEVVPIDLAEDSELRKRFSKGVLKKDVAAVKGYWQQLVFTGRGVPPVEKASEAEVMAYVAANRNAVGYVSLGIPLASGVKTIRVTE